MEQYPLTYKFFETFNEDKLSFAYMGALSNQMVVSSINLIENNLAKDNSFRKLRHKLSFLMIESFQNIIRYGDEPTKDLKYRKEMFIVRNIGGTFYIGSCNLIENQKIDFVNSKLREVNELDSSDLDSLYRKILTNNRFTDAGGAGLGFIEMARKTRQKLQYSFEKIDDDYSYFYLLIRVNSELKNSVETFEMNINWFLEFHHLACAENLIVMHKGNFSPIVIDPVINMVENNIKTKAINVQKLTFHIIIEALQNLSLHSLGSEEEKEAIFIIRKKNNHYNLSTGNFIKKTKVGYLLKQLDGIKKMPKIDLKRLYEETVHKKSVNKKSRPGLGLMEIALESNNKYDYHFQPLDKKVSFYTFDVEI
ncbi:MAG: SiaB family protein kinase [Bacteroidales bacterium]